MPGNVAHHLTTCLYRSYIIPVLAKTIAIIGLLEQGSALLKVNQITQQTAH